MGIIGDGDIEVVVVAAVLRVAVVFRSNLFICMFGGGICGVGSGSGAKTENPLLPGVTKLIAMLFI